jgi:phage shock protein C
MTCHNCRKEILEGSAYCYHCGARQLPPSAAAAAAQKRLMRSRRDKKIGGVCAGVSEYFSLDVTLVRVVWLLVVLLGGTGLLAYLVCWIVIPLEPEIPPVPVPAAHAS